MEQKYYEHIGTEYLPTGTMLWIYGIHNKLI